MSIFHQDSTFNNSIFTETEDPDKVYNCLDKTISHLAKFIYQLMLNSTTWYNSVMKSADVLEKLSKTNYLREVSKITERKFHSISTIGRVFDLGHT